MTQKTLAIRVTLFLLLVLSTPLLAQKTMDKPYIGFISGKVVSEKGDALAGAAIEILSLPDSVTTETSCANKNGAFSLAYNGDSPDYMIRISYIGMETMTDRFRAYHQNNFQQAFEKSINKTFTLREKQLSVEEVQIVGELKKMFMKGDTLIYNTDAYRLSEGAVLIDLVKKLPGIYMKDSRLMYQGKQITEIKLNGESFFASDMNIALQNVPVSELSQVKVYDDMTEHDKRTGNDSGRRNTVMDMTTRRVITDIRFANIAAGITVPEQRYHASGDISAHTRGKGEVSLKGSMDNLPSDQRAETIKRLLGATFKKTLDNGALDASIDYAWQKDIDSLETSTQRYLDTHTLSNRSKSESAQHSQDYTGRLKYTDRITQHLLLSANATLRKGKTDNLTRNSSAAATDNSMTNSHSLTSNGRGDRQQLTAGLSLTRPRTDNGRWTTELDLGIDHDRSTSDAIITSSTRYYNLGDTVCHRSQYVEAPTRTTALRYKLDATYTHKALHLSLAYRGQYSTSRQQRTVYSRDGISIGGWDETNTLLGHRDDSQTYDFSHNTLTNGLYAMLSYRPTKSLTVSLAAEPHTRRISIDRILTAGHEKKRRTFSGINPSVSVRKTFGRSATLRLAYDGTCQAPDASQLLPMTVSDNPLFIVSGNDRLRQSYTNRLSLSYNHGATSADVAYTSTHNAISSRMTHNEDTGVYTSMPDNINGNWAITTNLMTGTYIGNLSLGINSSYDHSVMRAYLSSVSDGAYAVANAVAGASDAAHTMKNDLLMADAYAGYQWTAFDLRLSEAVLFTHNSDAAQPQLSSSAKDYTTTLAATWRLPYGLTLSSDISLVMRRDYTVTLDRKNEWVWNADVTYRFLKRRAAALSLKVYDILGQRSAISRSADACGFTDTRRHQLYNYALLSFKYHFALMK